MEGSYWLSQRAVPNAIIGFFATQPIVPIIRTASEQSEDSLPCRQEHKRRRISIAESRVPSDDGTEYTRAPGVVFVHCLNEAKATYSPPGNVELSKESEFWQDTYRHATKFARDSSAEAWDLRIKDQDASLQLKRIEEKNDRMNKRIIQLEALEAKHATIDEDVQREQSKLDAENSQLKLKMQKIVKENVAKIQSGEDTMRAVIVRLQSQHGSHHSKQQTDQVTVSTQHSKIQRLNGVIQQYATAKQSYDSEIRGLVQAEWQTFQKLGLKSDELRDLADKTTALHRELEQLSSRLADDTQQFDINKVPQEVDNAWN